MEQPGVLKEATEEVPTLIKKLFYNMGNLLIASAWGSGDIVDMLTFYSDTGKTGIKLCTSQKLHMLPANDPVFSNT